MARKKTKFKMTIKELSFEFEGDEEEAQEVQAGLNRLLNGITHTPNQLLDVEEADYRPVEALPSASENQESNDKKKSKKRGPRDPNRSKQILILKDEGYFSERRDLSEIRQALANKGFNYPSKDIASGMKYLTQKGEFQRVKQDGNFVYWSDEA